MFSKIKNYLIGAVIIFLISSVVAVNIQHKAIVRLRAEKIRLTENIGQLLDENADYQVLTLTQKEAFKAATLKIDSISHLLKIKPKTIERIIYQTVIQHDTTIKYVPVVQINDTLWKFTDVGNCFVYKGEVLLTDKELSVKRTDFTYHNEAINVFHKHRKFWIFSRWRYEWETVPKCGTFKTTEINIVKRK
jgi:hypothetical protein